MNTTEKLINNLVIAYRVRCKFWLMCNTHGCSHFEPHRVGHGCVSRNPVKYCPQVRGFVYDIPYQGGNYANDECDPNLAFKAKRDAERRNNV